MNLSDTDLEALSTLAITGTTYHALREAGAFKDDVELSIGRQGNVSLTLVMDRSFAKQPDYEILLEQVGDIAAEHGLCSVEIINQGGAAMNAMWVIENTPAIYFKLSKPEDGGGSLWDYAASACLFAELGTPAADISGRPLQLNREGTTFMNHDGVAYASDPHRASRTSVRGRRPLLQQTEPEAVPLRILAPAAQCQEATADQEHAGRRLRHCSDGCKERSLARFEAEGDGKLDGRERNHCGRVFETGHLQRASAGAEDEIAVAAVSEVGHRDLDEGASLSGSEERVDARNRAGAEIDDGTGVASGKDAGEVATDLCGKGEVAPSTPRVIEVQEAWCSKVVRG